jgi:PAS domain S-box-containing protein
VLGGAVIVANGYSLNHLEPSFVDPLWLRWIVASLPVALAIASMASEAVRREINGLAYVMLYVLVAWAAALVALNALAPAYVVLALCVVMVVGVVASAGFSSPVSLAAVLGVTVIIMGIAVAVAMSLGPVHVHPTLVVGATALCAGVLLSGAWPQLRMRDRLMASEHRYRTVFDRVADGIVLVDHETLRVLAANEAYLHTMGYSLQDLRTRSLYELCDARRDEVDRDIQRALEAGRADLGERRHFRPDGGTHELDMGLATLQEGRRRLLCLTTRDLSQEKRDRIQVELARDQAQAMLELRTAFLNNMSHELRTPLVAINGFLDLLETEDDDLDAEERRDMLGSLRRSAHRLSETLNSVLDLAQIEGGFVNFQLEPIEMNRAVRDAAETLAPLARTKGVEFRLEHSEPARAMVDRTALHRILFNLVSNAVKFTRRGEISVSVEADSHRVLVHVRDTGIGIEADLLPQLFTAFRQASAGHGREHEGSGLGLTISKRLLDMLGGRIKVESTPGEGTVVTVAFARTWASPETTLDGSNPLPEPHLRSAHAPRAPLLDALGERSEPEPIADPTDGLVSISPLASRPRALVVEDNSDTARLVSRLLSDIFDVDIAYSGDEAIERAKTTWYDVLVLDIHLGPGINGIGLLQHFRAMSAYAFVPAVAMTAHDTFGDRARFLSHGFDAFIPKPFNRKQLLAAIQEAHTSRVSAAAV